MKHIITVLLALVSSLLPMHATDNGHSLGQLWSKYEQAHKADLPQKEAAILLQIRSEAASKRLPADFYDAATLYVQAVVSRDWKQRTAMQQELEAQVKAFDYPLVTFLWMLDSGKSSDEAAHFVSSRFSEFEGSHPSLHRGIGSYLNGALAHFVRSDREYVLWRLLEMRSYKDINDDEIYQALRKEVKGQYPSEAALEYYVINATLNGSEKKEAWLEALRNLAARYQGKAVALFPRQDLLLEDFTQLNRRQAAGTDYRRLYEACTAFESQRKAFEGEESIIADAVTRIKQLCEQLCESHLWLNTDGKIATVQFQNLDKATLKLFRQEDSKTVLHSWNLVNAARSFYAPDTLNQRLPAVDDGSYYLEATSGKYSNSAFFEQYSLSLALRQQAAGSECYVADSHSGAPLGKVSLRLYKNGKVVATSALSLKGFTKLPQALVKIIDAHPKTWYELEAVSGTRLSRKMGFYRQDLKISSSESTRCEIYRDRGAYNPGDTLKLKFIVYKGEPRKGYKVLSGSKLSVILSDSEGNRIAKEQVTSGEFGSAACSFELPKGLRNGWFSLEVKEGNHSLAYDWFRVDEFVLPTFDLKFDSLEGKLIKVGDPLKLSGKIISYSGHHMSGAQISARVQRWGDVLQEEQLSLDGEDRFEMDVNTSEEGYYRIEVRVTEAGGETREFSTGLYVSSSITVGLRVNNNADADLSLINEPSRHRWYYRPSRPVVNASAAQIVLEARNANGDLLDIPVSYEIGKKDGAALLKGDAVSGKPFSVDLTSLESGLYELRSKASEGGLEAKNSSEIFYLAPGESKVPEGVSRIMLAPEKEVSEGGVSFRIGSGAGKIYGVASLIGDAYQIIDSKLFTIGDGVVGEIGFDYASSCPDAVRLHVLYFLNDSVVTYERQFRRAKDKLSLPLSFTRISNKLYPGAHYRFELKSEAGVEALAAVWDKSIDAIAPLHWNRVSMSGFTVPSVDVYTVCGSNSADSEEDLFEGRAAGVASNKLGTRSTMMFKAAAPVADGAMVEEEGAVLYDSAAMESAAGKEDIPLRERFEEALCFEPQLRSDSKGVIGLEFDTSDKLSTYYVRVLAHDKTMRSALVQDEVLVTLPVKVELNAPRQLYVGDVYEAAVSVSSISDAPVAGVLSLEDGEKSQQFPIEIAAGQRVTKLFRMNVDKAGSLSLTARFKGDGFADAMKVEVPVSPAAQQLSESHSAVLHAGDDAEALIRELRSRFVNTDGANADLREISILDMIKEAIPEHADPKGEDVISLTEAWYVRQRASLLGVSAPEDDLMGKILACRNSDGGFGWFEGMPSSPVVTAVVLHRMAAIAALGINVPGLDTSVLYLDKEHFGGERPFWYGCLSDAQYMYVRSMYASVPFQWKAGTNAQKDLLKAFKKNAKAYLTPSAKDGRGLNGRILDKARRLLTLRLLLEKDGGIALAKQWGISLGSKSALSKSLNADAASLMEYAVEHRDGGWYYPNAVMPWRGLLEGEAYAHSLLCDLLDGLGKEKASEIADGIRLWLMLQKETQKWDSDPSFVDAIGSVLKGSKEVLETKVIVLSKSFEAPFKDISAAGNGFSISRTFFRQAVREQVYDNSSAPRNRNEAVWEPLREGEVLNVGEKVMVRYDIWNAENRSFVRLSAPREASLQPVEQLSGHVGYGFVVPLRSGVSFGFIPHGYRNVKAERSEYFFDAYPEESTSISETFFVVQAGEFQAPVVSIESLYAPHYSAVDAYKGPVKSR